MTTLCLGEATKVSAFLLDADKHYLVTGRLGIKTDTGDADGKIIAQAEVPRADRSTFQQVLEEFHGTMDQVPPMHSALKHEGRRLYELARAGVEVELVHRSAILVRERFEPAGRYLGRRPASKQVAAGRGGFLMPGRRQFEPGSHPKVASRYRRRGYDFLIGVQFNRDGDGAAIAPGGDQCEPTVRHGSSSWL